MAIMEANARRIRYAAECDGSGATRAVIGELQAELDDHCRRALADLVPVAGRVVGKSSESVVTFLRYLLRNMDLAERTAMLEAAREADAFVDRLAAVSTKLRETKAHAKPSPTPSPLPDSSSLAASSGPLVDPRAESHRGHSALCRTQLPTILASLGWERVTQSAEAQPIAGRQGCVR